MSLSLRTFASLNGQLRFESVSDDSNPAARQFWQTDVIAVEGM
jgi:hypothetical protein